MERSTKSQDFGFIYIYIYIDYRQNICHFGRNWLIFVTFFTYNEHFILYYSCMLIIVVGVIGPVVHIYAILD